MNTFALCAIFAAAVSASASEGVVRTGIVHPLARQEFEIGRADRSGPATRIVLALKPSPERRIALEQFLVDQQNPASPDFHQWVTPQQFGERFGRTSEEIATVTRWLGSQGFAVDEVSPSRLSIDFSGTIGDVERAFHTEIHEYRVAKGHDGPTPRRPCFETKHPSRLGSRRQHQPFQSNRGIGPVPSPL